MPRKLSLVSAVIFFAVLFSNNSFGSDSPYRISLLTYSSGAELYSTFGHSALRVQDSLLNTDFVYNYGTFDFYEPGFYLKFIKGKLLYSLSRLPTEYVIRATSKENRELFENELLLNPKEKTTLIKILENNYLPENRTYLYDFFYDNCATRIIDVIDSATDNRFNVNEVVNYTPTAFSKLIRPCLDEHKWTKLGMDIVMGLAALKKASLEETAFLPEHLLLFLSFSTDLGTNEALLGEKKTLLSSFPDNSIPTRLSPRIAFLFIFMFSLGIKYYENKYCKPFKWLDKIIIGLPVFIGILLISFWVISSHNIYAWNHSLLWANPLLAIHFFSKISKTKVYRYTITLFLTGALIISILFDRSLSVTLIILTIGLRLLPLKKSVT